MADDSDPGLVIPTRQKTDTLFFTKDPLPVGTRTLAVKLVMGYAAIAFFGTASGPFDIRIFEACTSTGPFALTQTLSSSVAGAEDRLCERILQCGEFMRIEIVPTGGGLTALEVCGQGVPLP